MEGIPDREDLYAAYRDPVKKLLITVGEYMTARSYIENLEERNGIADAVAGLVTLFKFTREEVGSLVNEGKGIAFTSKAEPSVLFVGLYELEEISSSRHVSTKQLYRAVWLVCSIIANAGMRVKHGGFQRALLLQKVSPSIVALTEAIHDSVTADVQEIGPRLKELYKLHDPQDDPYLPAEVNTVQELLRVLSEPAVSPLLKQLNLWSLTEAPATDLEEQDIRTLLFILKKIGDSASLDTINSKHLQVSATQIYGKLRSLYDPDVGSIGTYLRKKIHDRDAKFRKATSDGVKVIFELYGRMLKKSVVPSPSRDDRSQIT